MKIRTILFHALDMADNYILRHKFYKVCCFIANADWGVEDCHCWYCRKFQE